MMEKTFTNEDLKIKLTSFIDKQQNIWFRGKDVVEILGYSNVRKAVWSHVSKDHKILQLYWSSETERQQNDTRGKYCTFIDEAGFYGLFFFFLYFNEFFVLKCFTFFLHSDL